MPLLSKGLVLDFSLWIENFLKGNPDAGSLQVANTSFVSSTIKQYILE